MLKKTIVVMAESGLHARPADIISKESLKYQSSINFIKDEKAFNAKSMLSIMTMAVDPSQS